MPERIGIEILVRKHFVSEAANTIVRSVTAKDNGTKLSGKLNKLLLSNMGETRLKKTLEALGENHSNLSIRSNGMGKEEGEAIMQREGPQPKVQPKGGG
jgi:hypothetical protein